MRIFLQKKSELKTNSFPLSLFPLESTASIQSFRKHKNPLSTDSFWLRLSLQMSMSNSIGAGGDAGREHGQFDVGGVSPFLQKNHESIATSSFFGIFFSSSEDFSNLLSLSLALRIPLSLSLSLSLSYVQKKKTGSRGAGQRALVRKPARRRHGLRRARRGRDARHDRQGRARHSGLRPGDRGARRRRRGRPRRSDGGNGGLQGSHPGEQPAAGPAGEAAARGGAGA